MGKIISFHGADHKCGTSQMTCCCLEYMANTYKDKNFLMVNASSGQGAYCFRGVGESIENIRPYLSRKISFSEDLLVKCHYKDNIYILGGPANPESFSDFNPDMVQYLFEFAGNIFDYILVDTGAESFSGTALGALFSADKRYIVFNQSESSFLRFEWMKNLYRKLDIYPDRYVINLYDKDSVYSKIYIAERLGTDRNNILYVRENRNAENADIEGLSLLKYKDRRFDADIKKLTEDI